MRKTVDAALVLLTREARALAAKAELSKADRRLLLKYLKAALAAASLLTQEAPVPQQKGCPQ